MPFSNFFTPPTSTYIEPVAVEHAPNTSDWSLPIDTPDPLMAQDKPEVLADRSRTSYVYTLSRNAGFGLPTGAGGDGQLLFARSTDGGKSFADTVLADAHSESASFGIPRLVQLRDGTLLATTGFFPGTLAAGSFRSTDRGAHWSAPGASQPSPPASAHLTACGTGVVRQTFGGQDAVLGGHRILGINVVNKTPTGPARIIMSRSSDAGRSWVNFTSYRSKFPVGLASIATDKAGRIGMVFDQADMSHVTCSPSAKVPVRTEFVVSSDEGHTWSSPTRIGARWWNFASSPPVPFFGGYWIGDYSTVAAVPGPGLWCRCVRGSADRASAWRSNHHGSRLDPSRGTPRVWRPRLGSAAHHARETSCVCGARSPARTPRLCAPTVDVAA
jgi:hypothetical protein